MDSIKARLKTSPSLMMNLMGRPDTEESFKD